MSLETYQQSLGGGSQCPSEGKWRYWIIFLLTIVTIVASGICFFTVRYKMEGETDVDEKRNIKYSSMVNFIISCIVLFLVVLVLFFSKRISRGLYQASTYV